MSTTPNPNVVVECVLVFIIALISCATRGFVAGLGFSLFITLIALTIRMALNLAQIMRPSDTIVLHSLGPSPFVEKIRWTMWRLGLHFREQAHLGITFPLTGHSLPMLSFPSGWSRSYITNSSDIAAYLYGRHALEQRAQFLTRTEDARQLETMCDEVGRQIQRLVYYYLLEYENGAYMSLARQFWGANDTQLGFVSRRIVQPLVAPLQRQLLRRIFQLTRPNCVEKATSIINAAFDELDERLGDGRRYLECTDSLAYSDICVCSMLGILLILPEYGSRACYKIELAAMPPPFQRYVEELRRRPTGEWIQRVYAHDRRHGGPAKRGGAKKNKKN